MKFSLAGCILAVAALGVSSPGVYAHTDEVLATIKAPHGGQLKMAGPYHLELVVKPGEVQVYITNHGDTKIASQGGKGSATVLSGKKKSVVTLIPAGENLMQGKGDFSLAPDMKVVVSVVLPGQSSQQARFTPGKTD